MSGGTISVQILLDKIEAFKQQVTGAGTELKNFGTSATGIATSFGQVDTKLGTTGQKAQELGTKVRTTGGDMQKAKGDSDQLGQSVTKTGQNMDTMKGKSEGASSGMQQFGVKAKDAALAVAGFATSLFNTYLQYDSLKDQELNLSKTREKLNDRTTDLALRQQNLNKEMEDGGKEGKDYAAAQQEIDEMQKILAIDEERYTDAMQDKNNAWKSFGLSLLPTAITGMSSISLLMGKFGTTSKTTAGGLSILSGGFGGLLGKIAPIGIALAAAGAAFYAIKNNMFGVRDALNSFGVAIGQAMPPLIPFLNFIKNIGIAIGLLPKEFATIERDMTTGAYNIKEGMTGNFTDIITTVTNLGASLQKSVTDFSLWGQSILQMLGEGKIIEAVTKIVEAIQVNFTNAFKFTSEQLLPAVQSFIQYFGTTIVPLLPALITTIIDGFVNAWKWTTDVIDTIWKAFQDEVITWFDDNKDGFVEDIMKELLKAFGWKKDDIDKFMKDFSKHLQNWAKDPAAELQKVGEAIATNIVNAINFVAEPVLGFINEHVFPLFSEILNAVSKIDWTDVGEAVGTGVVNAVTWVSSAVTAALTGMWDEFVKKAETNLTGQKGDVYTQFGENAGAFLIKLITVGGTALGDFSAGFWEKVLDAIFGEGAFETIVNAARLLQGKNPLQKTTTNVPLTTAGEVGGVKTISTKQTQKAWEEVGWDKYLEGKIPPEILGGAKYASDTFWGNWYGMEKYGNQLNKGISGAGKWLSDLFGGKTNISPQLIPGGTISPEQVFDIVSSQISPKTKTTTTTPKLSTQSKTNIQNMTSDQLSSMIDQALTGQFIPYSTAGGMKTSQSLNYPAGKGLNYPSLRTKTQNATLSEQIMADINKQIFSEQGAFQFPSNRTQTTPQLESRFGAGSRLPLTQNATIGGGEAMGMLDPTALAKAWENAVIIIQKATEQIATLVLQLQTSSSASIIGISQALLGMSTNASLVPPVFQSMAEQIGVLLLQMQTIISEVAIGVSEAFLGLSTNVSLVPPVFQSMAEQVGVLMLQMQTVVSEVVIGIGQALLGISQVISEFTNLVSVKTTESSAYFLTMKTSIESTLKTLTTTITNFATTTMKDFGDKTSVQTTAVSGSFKVMADNVDKNVKDIIDDIDDLIDKLEELAKAQDKADSGGNGGGESKLEWTGGSGERYGGSWLAHGFQSGGRFISKKPTLFRGRRISELGKWEEVTVKPLSNPYASGFDKNSRIQVPVPVMTTESSGRNRPIQVSGNITVIQQTPDGKLMSKTLAPFLFEAYSSEY